MTFNKCIYTYMNKTDAVLPISYKLKQINVFSKVEDFPIILLYNNTNFCTIQAYKTLYTLK